MEASVIVREHFNNWYALSMYYLSKVLADLPLMVSTIMDLRKFVLDRVKVI